MRGAFLVLLVLLVPVFAGCFGPRGPGPEVLPTRPSASGAGAELALSLVGDGFSMPVQIIDPNDGSGRFLVVEQSGTVRWLANGSTAAAPFLDLGDRVKVGGEQGLLSIALSPHDATVVFVSYTDAGGNSVVERYHTHPDDATRVDMASGTLVLHVDQPYGNHNGGLVLFGPDGYLWVGLGDGGLAGDPHGNAQDSGTLLGSLLRLDVSSKSRPYASPSDNPYTARSGRLEIAHIGLRNPWRFSFDRETGDLYVGDVGENEVEEINHVPRGMLGLNFGWNAWEGSETYRARTPTSTVTFPVAEYTHSATGGCSVTGGYVYRGTAMPELVGSYLYGDYCTGTVWGLTRDSDDAWATRALLESGKHISSFGEDAAGEVYLVDHDGAVYRFVSR